MLVAAALVPDTALLVPGAGGRADAGAALRSAALAAVREAVAALPPQGGSLAIVVPGARTREVHGRVRGSLGSAGVPDDMLGWPVPVVVVGAGESGDHSDAGVPVSVALHLVAQVGSPAPVRVVEVAADDADLGVLGARLVADEPTVLLVVGSGSGRHGPDAPVADDRDAPAYDAQLLADLALADADARRRLASADPDQAHHLAVTGWAPWQVLLGAAGHEPVVARLEVAQVLAGAQHAAVLWRAA